MTLNAILLWTGAILFFLSGLLAGAWIWRTLVETPRLEKLKSDVLWIVKEAQRKKP